MSFQISVDSMLLGTFGPGFWLNSVMVMMVTVVTVVTVMTVMMVVVVKQCHLLCAPCRALYIYSLIGSSPPPSFIEEKTEVPELLIQGAA